MAGSLSLRVSAQALVLTLLPALVACMPLAVEVQPAPVPSGQAPLPLNRLASALAMSSGQEDDLSRLLRLPDGRWLEPKQLLWRSSDESVVRFTAEGKAVAGAAGRAVVMARWDGAGGPREASLEITVVEQAAVKAMAVSPSTQVLVVGDATNLQATVTLPDGQLNANVVWSSSDARLATVDGQGRVQALREGRVTLVASYAPDPRFKALAELTVVADRSQVPAAAATASSSSPSPQTGAQDMNCKQAATATLIFAGAVAGCVPPGAGNLPSSNTNLAETNPVAADLKTDVAVTGSSGPTLGLSTTLLAQPGSDLEVSDSGTIFYLSGTQAGNQAMNIRAVGKNWQRIGSLGERQLLGQHWFDDAHGILCGGGGQLLEVKISGNESTTTVLDSGTSDHLYDVLFVGAQNGFAVGEQGTYASSDGGKSWVQMSKTGGNRIVSDGSRVFAFLISNGSTYQFQAFGKDGVVDLSITQDQSKKIQRIFGSSAGLTMWVGSEWSRFAAGSTEATLIPTSIQTSSMIARGTINNAYPIRGGALVSHSEGLYLVSDQGNQRISYTQQLRFNYVDVFGNLYDYGTDRELKTAQLIR